MSVTKTTTDIDTLKINYLTEEMYEEALVNDEINEDELYFTPENNDIQVTTFTPLVGSSYSPWGGCFYQKLGHIVHLHLGISELTAGTGNLVYTLPSEVRPPAQISAAGLGGSVGQFSPVIISNGGSVTAYPQGNTYCTLDITYMV